MLGVTNSMSFGKENILPSRRACRSLFGPVDHDEVKKTLAREMDVLDTRQKLKWNFDFKNEVPLAGKFHWEKVTPDDARVPVAYTVMLRHLEPKETSSSVDEEVPAKPEPAVAVVNDESTTSSSLPDTPSQKQLENETTPPSQKPVSRKRKRSGQCTMTGRLGKKSFILIQVSLVAKAKYKASIVLPIRVNHAKIRLLICFGDRYF